MKKYFRRESFQISTRLSHSAIIAIGSSLPPAVLIRLVRDILLEITRVPLS